jgi:exodeoxyribonuclease VII small subunit
MPIEPDPDVTFEDALRQLEAIVDDLERGEPELSRALAEYERGVGLLAHCHAVLERAGRSVALLEGADAAGNPSTTSFVEDASAEIESPAPARPRARRPKVVDAADEPFIPF